MLRHSLPVLFCLALAACSMPEVDEQQQAVAQAEQREAEHSAPAAHTEIATDASVCDATQAEWTVGKTLSEADVEQAKKDAGAHKARTLKPGQAVTMEFDATRLNLDLDEKGVVSGVRCG